MRNQRRIQELDQLEIDLAPVGRNELTRQIKGLEAKKSGNEQRIKKLGGSSPAFRTRGVSDAEILERSIKVLLKPKTDGIPGGRVAELIGLSGTEGAHGARNRLGEKGRQGLPRGNRKGDLVLAQINGCSTVFKPALASVGAGFLNSRVFRSGIDSTLPFSEPSRWALGFGNTSSVGLHTSYRSCAESKGYSAPCYSRR